MLRAANFAWKNSSWEAGVILPSWRGFQCRRGAYGQQDSTVPSDGAVQLAILSHCSHSHTPAPLTDAELEPVTWTLQHERDMQQALTAALLPEYLRIRPKYRRFLGDKFDELMPDVRSADDFRHLIGLNIVYVHPPLHDGRPFVGFLFGCTWEVEHGLGVLMHGTSVVRIGGADASFSFWHPARPADESGDAS